MSESRLFSRRLLASSHFSWLLLLIVIATFCRCSLATSTVPLAEFLKKPFKDIKPKLDKKMEFLDDENVKRFERLELAILKAKQEQEFRDLLKYVDGQLSYTTLKAKQEQEFGDLLKYVDGEDLSYKALKEALKKKYGHAVMAVFEHLKETQNKALKKAREDYPLKYEDGKLSDETLADMDRIDKEQANQALSYVQAIYGASTITATMKIKDANSMTVGQYLKALRPEISKKSKKLKRSYRDTSELNKHLKELAGNLERIKDDLEKHIPELEKSIKQQNQSIKQQNQSIKQQNQSIKQQKQSIKQQNQSIKQLENLLQYEEKTFQNLKPLKEATEEAAKVVSELINKERRDKELRKRRETDMTDKYIKENLIDLETMIEPFIAVKYSIIEPAKRGKNKIIGALKRSKNKMIGAAIGAKNKIKGALKSIKNAMSGSPPDGRNFNPTVAPAKNTAAAK